MGIQNYVNRLFSKPTQSGGKTPDAVTLRQDIAAAKRNVASLREDVANLECSGSPWGEDKELDQAKDALKDAKKELKGLEKQYKAAYGKRPETPNESPRASFAEDTFRSRPAPTPRAPTNASSIDPAQVRELNDLLSGNPQALPRLHTSTVQEPRVRDALRQTQNQGAALRKARKAVHPDVLNRTVLKDASPQERARLEKRANVVREAIDNTDDS